MSNPVRFKVCFDWRVTALALLLLPVLLSLGFWQLDRAEEKRQLEALFAQKQARGPVPIEQLSVDGDLRYQPVQLRGTFILGKTIFLDNRIANGRFGYEVATPFQLATDGRLVLVNRGWVPGDPARRTLPTVATPGGVISLTGDVHVPQGKLLALADEQASGWPRVMQSLDVAALSDAFEHPLFPYSVRLDAGAPGALEANWVVVNLKPSRHTGYAVQWFAMSATLVLIALLANTNAWAWLTRRR